MSIDLSTLILGWIADYQAPLVAGLLFLGALGLPLPGSLVVIASGAFIRQSLLDTTSTISLGFLATIIGDAGLYGIGLLAGRRLEQRFGGTETWHKARTQFNHRGVLTIYLTRWLLSEVATPVTLIAGSSRYTFKKFLAVDILGELTWFAVYGGLGYAFGTQWELISDFLTNFSGFLLGAVVVGLGIVVLVRAGRAQKQKSLAASPQPMIDDSA
jgi:membrane-associated protein